MTGMMWVDTDSQKDLATKVIEAAAHYYKKYGVEAALCQVNPAAVDGDPHIVIAGIHVEAAPWILPHHYFMVAEESA